ncbi:MAG: AAA family ATPase [Polyangiales bacterium]
MRVALCGSHRVGKSTLAEAVLEVLPGHALVPEPYESLVEEGYEFAEEPALEDFEAQLERAIADVLSSGPDTVFDRCPLDLLGYLTTHPDAEAFELDDWMARIEAAVAKLDLIVFVPIEEPDRVPVPRSEGRLRAKVDAALQAIVVDDTYGLDFSVITVEGSLSARLHQVVAAVRDQGK